MATAVERSTAELRGLGLSALEAAAYLHLLRHAPASGYRVARALGKAAANVYAALESLRAKGAVVREEGGARNWRAVAPASLERVFAERFRERTRRLVDVLGAWQEGEDDGGIYALGEPGLVFAQAETMLAAARTVVVADLFPGPLQRLAPALEAAAARGVAVAVQAYRPAALRDVEVIVGHRGREVLARWAGPWLQLVVDGSAQIVALLSPGGERVAHSTWTTNPHLAWTAHSALTGDLVATRLIAALEAGESTTALKALARRLQKRLRAPEAEGYRRILGAGAAQGKAVKGATAPRRPRGAAARES